MLLCLPQQVPPHRLLVSIAIDTIPQLTPTLAFHRLITMYITMGAMGNRMMKVSYLIGYPKRVVNKCSKSGVRSYQYNDNFSFILPVLLALALYYLEG